MSFIIAAAVLAGAAAIGGAAGTVAGGQPTGGEGLSSRLNAINRRSQADTTESNARLSNMFAEYRTKTEQFRLEGEGALAEMTGKYTRRGEYRQGRSNFAVGQAHMFERQREGDRVSSDFQTQAAASGFIATEGDLAVEADAIEQRGAYLAKMELYGAKISRNTSFARGDVAEAEGNYANALAGWQSTAVGGHGELERMMATMTAQRQANALRQEASGYDWASQAAIHAGEKKKNMAYLAAGTSLLGAAGQIAGGPAFAGKPTGGGATAAAPPAPTPNPMRTA